MMKKFKPEPRKLSINDAARIIDNEGLTYAVQSYCRSTDFTDKKLAKLWDNAKKAIGKLEQYIEDYKTDED